MEFKKYNYYIYLSDSGTRLLSGQECCVMQSVSHVLWDCPAYTSIRSAFMLELRRELGDRFEHFQSLDSFEK